MCDQGLTKLNGDEAFYMKHQNGQLKGMILLHVDDFMIGGSNEFVDGITDVFCKELTVSTIEDSLFRYCVIDMELKENKIIMSMEDYVASLEEADLGKSKKCTKLNKFEQRTFRKITGKLMWLAENIRIDLSYGALQLSMRSQNSTIRDLKLANSLIRKAKSKTSVLVFGHVGNPDDLVIHGIGDASYASGEKAVGGQVILLGHKSSTKAVPIFWKSKLIKQVCHSPKDAETRNLVKTVDLARFMGDQLSQLLFGPKEDEKRVDVKIYTDSKATLDSIASTHQIEQRMLRSSIADLKQKLETKSVKSYEWMTDDNMIADILTKEKKTKEGIDELMEKNILDALNKE